MKSNFYKNEHVNPCFTILCHDRNIGAVKTTCGSLKSNYPNNDRICIVPSDTNNNELGEFNLLCPTYAGGNTWASLINLGMKKSTNNWNIFVIAGSWVCKSVLRKINMFCKDKKDVIFPIVDMKMNFTEGSINGLCINKDTFKEVGDFITTPMVKSGVNEFEMVKLFWAIDAFEKGCKFKGIVGLHVG